MLIIDLFIGLDGNFVCLFVCLFACLFVCHKFVSMLN